MNAPSLEMNAITVEAGEAEGLAVRRVVDRAARPYPGSLGDDIAATSPAS